MTRGRLTPEGRALAVSLAAVNASGTSRKHEAEPSGRRSGDSGRGTGEVLRAPWRRTPHKGEAFGWGEEEAGGWWARPAQHRCCLPGRGKPGGREVTRSFRGRGTMPPGLGTRVQRSGKSGRSQGSRVQTGMAGGGKGWRRHHASTCRGTRGAHRVGPKLRYAAPTRAITGTHGLLLSRGPQRF